MPHNERTLDEVILAPLHLDRPSTNVSPDLGCIDPSKSIIHCFRECVARFGALDYLGYRAGLSTNARESTSTYTFLTYNEADALVTKLARIYQGLGVAPGTKVAIYAKNSPLWLLSDFALFALGAVSVPLYETLGVQNMLYALQHAEVSLILTQTEMLPQVFAIWPLCKSIRYIVDLDTYAHTLNDIHIDAIVQRSYITYAELDPEACAPTTTGQPCRMAHDTETIYSFAGNGSEFNGKQVHNAQPKKPHPCRNHSTPSDDAVEFSNDTDDALFYTKYESMMSDILGLTTSGEVYTPKILTVSNDISGEINRIASSYSFADMNAHCEQVRASKKTPSDALVKQSTTLLLLQNLLDDINGKEAPLYKDYNPHPDAPATIVYTSGTSGDPKGVVHTNRSILSAGCMASGGLLPHRTSVITGNTHLLLSYLPLGHIFERVAEILCTFRGVRIAYYGGSTRNISRDISLASPTILISVPRVTQKIYNSVIRNLNERRSMYRLLFFGAQKVKAILEPLWIHNGKCSVIDNTVFKAVRNALGGNMELIISGAGVLPQHVWNFLRLCTGCRVETGYGLTETCATGTAVRYTDSIRYLPIGRLVQNMEGKLVDVKERCGSSLREDNVGELCLKGNSLAREYFKQPHNPIRDSDGFFHTGDLCRLNPDHTLSFVRRLDFMTKSLMGEFVDVCGVERAAEGSPLIISCFVHVEPDKTFPVCLCVVDKQPLMHRISELMKGKQDDSYIRLLITDNLNIPEGITLEEYAAGCQVICKEIEHYVRKTGYKGFCVPKRTRWFVNIDWYSDPTLVTASIKKQRHAFISRYSAELGDMFRESDGL